MAPWHRLLCCVALVLVFNCVLCWVGRVGCVGCLRCAVLGRVWVGWAVLCCVGWAVLGCVARIALVGLGCHSRLLCCSLLKCDFVLCCVALILVFNWGLCYAVLSWLGQAVLGCVVLLR